MQSSFARSTIHPHRTSIRLISKADSKSQEHSSLLRRDREDPPRFSSANQSLGHVPWLLRTMKRLLTPSLFTRSKEGFQNHLCPYCNTTHFIESISRRRGGNQESFRRMNGRRAFHSASQPDDVKPLVNEKPSKPVAEKE